MKTSMPLFLLRSGCQLFQFALLNSFKLIF
uniref:Uncharacterized protein n=1 Tax=Arundo donax TaxID=35708 RepID=A0A0A9CID4_ARUDO